MRTDVSTYALKKLVVCGGNGFLGSRICKAAAHRGWAVTSISRSGAPHWASVTSSPNPPSWSSSVSWEKGDILNPATYTHHLDNADAVVHSMGILLEADYKGVISGKESPIAGLQRAFSASKQGTQNPLERKEGEPLRPQEKDGQLTYEVMNRDSALSLAQESAAKSIPTYLYISAAAGAPVLPARYITTKREAEALILSTFPSLRSIFIRAPFMYDSSRTFTLPIAAAGGIASMVNSAVGGRLTWLIGAGGIKPLKADTVADAVVEALEDADVRGVVEAGEIERLATRAWRKGML
ncbi:NAD dependent epimerase/dehydratase family protein-like protein [Trematosphaeria pertusa]|uniref:NAD dependent epimerase/dehydratase family protein-like protein n=1 Tax=Trematosphaeria pertusa TaxID=390896 RepID=A0A6A6IMH9_9PLEO|nr:NAD dependent epimerase/dehydratase family protein-like protein [Trematosphaeria pertusa]KAF2251298.1 NAD dependent epimerase/dehydratase family protein-like protein [Trematosphaeria pertusa]